MSQHRLHLYEVSYKTGSWKPGATVWTGRFSVIVPGSRQMVTDVAWNGERLSFSAIEFLSRAGGPLRIPVSIRDRDVIGHRATGAIEEWLRSRGRI